MKKQVLFLCMLVILALSNVLANQGGPSPKLDENGFANLVLKKGEVDPDAVA